MRKTGWQIDILGMARRDGYQHSSIKPGAKQLFGLPVLYTHIDVLG